MTGLILGLQHLGLPTQDLVASIAFYTALGFRVDHRQTIQRPGPIHVAFLQLGNLVLELYQAESAETTVATTPRDGPIDHLALDVTDVGVVWRQVLALGLEPLEREIQFIPFFSQGVSFFRIRGPSGEIIEFNQRWQ